MQIANLLHQKIVSILVPAIACTVLAQPVPQSDPPKDKAPLQENKLDEKKPDITAQRGGIEILSDTMGVDFGRYMKQLRYTVQSHWDPLVPAVARPPISKSGTVVIEFAIMKDGKIDGMKLTKSSNDFKLDAAAWGAIINSIPLPTLPPAFKGDSLRMRCSFAYNPSLAKPPLGAKPDSTR